MPRFAMLRSEPFELYLVMEWDDAETCFRHRREIPARYAGPPAAKQYIGLRESRTKAVERFKAVFPEQEISPHTHVLVRFAFSVEAVYHYATTSAGPEYQHNTVLQKVTLGDVSEDLGIWHFNGPLSVKAVAYGGAPVLVEAAVEALPREGAA